MELAHRLTSTRSGTVVLAALAAIAAGVAVFVYIDRYRASVDEGGLAATVLVAEQTIPKGMAGDVVAADRLFRLQQLRREDVTNGALTDTAALRGKVATRDVLPGEQITASAFGATASGLASRLRGGERAVSISLDSQHGLGAQVQQGDHVDVLVGFNTQSSATGIARPVVKVLLQDIPVLAVTGQGAKDGSQSKRDVVVRVSDAQAAQVAYAVENGKVWLALRPRAGAPEVHPPLVTLESVLAGSKAVR